MTNLSSRLGRYVCVVAPSRHLRLVTVLVVTMAASTMALTVFGVLASELISFMGIERWQVGMLATAGTLGGAALSSRLGKWVDEVGGRRAAVTTLMVAGGSLFCVGIAPEFSLMVGAAFLTGIASALANPATNKLISVEIKPGRRGLIMGVKQSGVQISTFFGGWLLPVFTGWWGWRWAVMAFAAVPLTIALSHMGKKAAPDAARPAPNEDDADQRGDAGQRDDAGQRRDTARTPARLPPLVHRLAIYGFLLGVGGIAVVVYLPLYAEEVLGMSRGQAGLVLAVTGPVGILARIGWARVAEGRLGLVRTLMIIALLGVVSGIVFAFGNLVGTWSIWLAAALIGLSVFAWTSVGMLAVIQILPASLAGRGSGVVFFGFMSGFGVGAPLFGWSVDALGVYRPGWLGITVLFAVGFLVMSMGRR